MSTSTETLTPCSNNVQEEAHSLIPFGAGYTAPPPTPLASIPPPLPPSHDFLLRPSPLISEPGAHDNDDDAISPPTSTHTASPPSKDDLDALAQYLLHQSLHSTPNLLASPSLHRKRRTSMNVALAVQPDHGEEEVHVVNSRNDINIVEVLQTYSYASGFCEESIRGIGKACQEMGAFNIVVQDAQEALMMLRGRHGADDESVVEGGLIPISQLLTSTSQHHQHDMLDLDPLAFDSSIVDTNFRDTMKRFAKLLSRISKDLLRFLLEDLSIETPANIRDHSLKPLLYIHGNGKKELNLDEDVVMFISHDIAICEDDKSALFLARLGTRLQTWSQGKYKASIVKSPCNKASGEVCMQFALIHHH